MKNIINKKSFLIICLSLFLGVLGGFGIYYVKNKTERKPEDDISSLIGKINALNENFKTNNLDSNDYYMVGNNHCYKYIGNNFENIAKEINNLYESSSYGAIEIDKNSNTIHVCIPNYCNDIVDIEKYEIIDQSDNEKILNINNETNGVSYVINKIEGKWKIKFPIINCK